MVMHSHMLPKKMKFSQLVKTLVIETSVEHLRRQRTRFTVHDSIRFKCQGCVTNASLIY